MNFGGRTRLIASAAVAAAVLGTAFAVYSVVTTPRLSDPSVRVEPGSAVTAVLDQEREWITLPLDEYLMSPQQVGDALAARDHLVSDCLTAQGLDPLPVAASEPISTGQNRLWGSWSVSYAEAYGWSKPSAELDPGYAELLTDSAWSDALWDCYSATDASGRVVILGEASGAGSEPGTEFARVVQAGMMDSETAVRTSPEFDRVRQDYERCLDRAGYRAQDDFGIVTDESDTDAPVVSATCNRDAGVVRTLGDIKASYQAAYIAKHQDELAEVAKQRDDIVARIDAILADHAASTQ
jgi:hypothetical protein